MAGEMRLPTVCAALLVAIGCGAPREITLADVAGRWSMRAVPTSGADTSATPYILVATADTTGWTMTLPGREPVPIRVVAIGGDSIMIAAGPYASARRPGATVATRGVLRLEGDRLRNTTVAHYRFDGRDSVLHLRSEGLRAP